MIRFSCSHCGKSISVKDEYAGKRGKCPTCKQPVSVPSASPTIPIKNHEDSIPPKSPDRLQKKHLPSSHLPSSHLPSSRLPDRSQDRPILQTKCMCMSTTRIALTALVLHRWSSPSCHFSHAGCRSSAWGSRDWPLFWELQASQWPFLERDRASVTRLQAQA